MKIFNLILKPFLVSGDEPSRIIKSSRIVRSSLISNFTKNIENIIIIIIKIDLLGRIICNYKSLFQHDWKFLLNKFLHLQQKLPKIEQLLIVFPDNIYVYDKHTLITNLKRLSSCICLQSALSCKGILFLNHVA